jgi:RimJ/RimL family protein N-acetyltransferase
MISLIDVYHGTGILPGALDFLYELMKEREPEINISHREMPTMEQHRAFVTRRPYRFWYLVEAKDFQTRNPARAHPWIGYISATHANEIGIVLLKAWRFHGFGQEVVRELMRLHQPLPAAPSVRNGHWLANIAPNNLPSVAMFQKLGFRWIQATYEFNEEETNGKESTDSPA